MNNVKPTLCLKKISKSFKQGSQNLEVLKGVDLEIMPGEIVALIGPSGSGKSTLLQIAGLLDRPSKGEITLDEMKCSKLGDGMRTALRRDYLGFVYQYHNLLADFDATAVDCRRQCRNRPRKIALAVGTSGVGQTPETSSGGAFRRRTAACGDCPGTGQYAEAAAGGRTNRKS